MKKYIVKYKDEELHEATRELFSTKKKAMKSAETFFKNLTSEYPEDKHIVEVYLVTTKLIGVLK